MIKNAINDFLKEKAITSEKIESFKKSLIKNYGYKEFKVHSNLLTLKILNLELKEEKKTVIKLKAKKRKLTASTSPNSNKKLFRNYINRIQNKDIPGIAEELQIKPNVLLNVFYKHGMHFQLDSIINDIALYNIRYYIKSRFDQIKSIEVKEKIEKSGRVKIECNPLKFGNSVYDKISSNKGVGKLIYIRKK